MKKRNLLYLIGAATLLLGLLLPGCSDGGSSSPGDLTIYGDPQNLLILQAYGSSSNAAGVSHSFVELYNPEDKPVKLDGLSLQYAAGTRPEDVSDPIATEDGPWAKIDLSGTINAGCSFLILGQKQNTNASGSNAPRLIIEDGYGDINDDSFILGNRSFKAALMNTTVLLGNDVQNPFDTDGSGTKVPGYIDMVGSLNDPADARPDQILGFETAPARNSASESARRKDLIDTDNNSADFECIRYNPTGTPTDIHILAGQDWKLEHYRPKNSAYGQWDPADVPEPPEPVKAGDVDSLEHELLILQAFASSSTAAGASNSFVELYNTTTADITMNGITLYYANGTNTGGSSADGPWNKLPLDGKIIPAKGSYLILGPKQSPTAAQYQIPENYGDINDPDFTLSNRAFKVVLLRNDKDLEAENPFDMGSGAKAEGYIDMLGAANTYPASDTILGFETYPARCSASEAARRKDLTDTDDNSTDFIAARYNGMGNTEWELKHPRNSSAGAWDPFEEPPEPTGTEELMILQIGAATDGNISHSFVELYNNTDNPINLAGFSMQYAAGFSTNTGNGSGPEGNTTTDGNWVKIDLSGSIPPHHSFLILGSEGVGQEPGTNPALSITSGSGDMNESFVINNRCFKVALMSNTTLLTVQNPFTSNGGGKEDGYVDMVGALNTTGTDYIQGYETNSIKDLNKQTGQRRTSLTDTDNNMADFARATYAGASVANIEIWRPKNLAYGAWDPITGEKE